MVIFYKQCVSKDQSIIQINQCFSQQCDEISKKITATSSLAELTRQHSIEEKTYSFACRHN